MGGMNLVKIRQNTATAANKKKIIQILLNQTSNKETKKTNSNAKMRKKNKKRF
jgi:hypothetical protein